MLLALVFRGVAFEFRWRDPGHRAFWDVAFSGGSLLAALSRGVILGALLQVVAVQDRAYAGGWWDWLTPFTLLTGVSVGVATPFLSATYFDAWLRWPGVLAVLPVPVLVGLASIAFARSLKAGHDAAPFVLTLCIFLLCFVGLTISVFPYVVPGAVTIWQAATDRSSQVFMRWGTGIVLPMILAYTAWSYWVFRGKVNADGYHA